MARELLMIADALSWLTLPHLSRTWSLVIWIGLVALTISLLVLTRTRWGQSKPISKCIALSVFAHLLLIIYAYCTHLWTAPPPLAIYDTYQIKILSESESQGDPAVSPKQLEVASQEKTQPSTLEPQPSGQELTESQLEEEQALKEPPPEAVEVETEPADFEPVQPETEQEPPVEEVPVAVQEQPMPVAEQVDEDVSLDTPAEPLAEPEVAATVTDRLPVTEFKEVPSPDDVVKPRVNPENTRLMSDRTDSQPAYKRPALYQYRYQGKRREMLKKYGGNAQTEAAVHSALQWLASHQNENGGWSPRVLEGGVERRIGGHDRKGAGGEADTGISGLVLLAFLGSGHTQWEGIHRKVVKRGLDYLVRQQAEDGNLAGSARLFARMYCHSMATLAISEAYAMSGDPRLAPVVQRAARYTIWAQHPTSGGWRYQPGDRGDTSQFGWQVMVLRSAQFAGVELSSTTRQLNTRFLRSVLHGQSGGLASYRPLQQPSRTMTAEALVCRAFLNWPRNEAAIQEGVQFITAELPGQGKKNFYYWYYASLALHQVQGPAWQRWNKALQAQLLTLQRRQGKVAGSWDPDTVWGAYGGRAYSTAMAALCLEVYYRYLPLYQ